MQRRTSALPPETTESPSLYETLLGSAFRDLPEPLRQFHTFHGVRQGRLRVQQGEGFLRRWLANVMKLPPAGDNVPLILEVTANRAGERWDRRFGDHLITTFQWKEGAHLVEQAGPLKFVFNLTVRDGSLHFQQVACRWGWFNLHGLGPTIEALVSGREHGWHVQVLISLPLLRMITWYEGEIECP